MANQKSSQAAAMSPDAACAQCHQAISDSYSRTAMAQGSGAALTHLEPGSYLHSPSGIRYTVFTRDGEGWMSYDRQSRRQAKGASLAGASPSAARGGVDESWKTSQPQQGEVPLVLADDHLQGEHQLSYFIGSGRHGRTYLYQVDGTWFELPINYYTRRAGWGMAPAFDQATSMPADLPTDPNCLHCHATSVAAPKPGTRSQYATAPFAQGGIGCSACHGDPSAHLAAHGHGPIINPGHLDVARRDSVCLSCHLEGDAVVYRAGRSLAGFQAGEDLSQTAVYFVRASRAGGGGRAASQYEALLRSACRRATGDRLTCTTCHDPHASPEAADRVAYYRGKCLACHTSPAMATHHAEQPDCAHCHMPTRATTDISHEQTTDHDIERLPIALEAISSPSSDTRSGDTLLPVGGWSSSDRELGLAYAQMAGRGDRNAGERALTLLVRAEAAGVSDPVLHAQLGFLRQMAGDRAQAFTEYQAALRQNPHEASALANLAVLDAVAGHPATAVQLLEQLIAADPAQTGAGLNLAYIECKLGDPTKARRVVATLARYNPDDPALRAFSATGNYAGQHCDLFAARAESDHLSAPSDTAGDQEASHVPSHVPGPLPSHVR